MTCNNCGASLAEAVISFEANADGGGLGMVRICNCGARSSFDPNPLDTDGLTPHAAQVAPAPQRRPIPGQPPKPSEPLNVIKLARVRLRELDREITRLRKLERERDELRRLLAATKQPSKAPRVVALKCATNQR